MDENSDLLIRCSDLRNILFQSGPATGSQGSVDLATFDGNPGYPESAELITACSDVWTVVTADQLRGLANLINSGTSKYGLFPIMRSVIEHSAWICWILDEPCTPLQRVARANLASLNSAEKLNLAASKLYDRDNAIAASARERYKKIRDETRRTFKDVLLSPMSIEGEKLPSPTEVVEHMGEVLGAQRIWVGVYHYLCGMANHPSLAVMEIMKVNEYGNYEIEMTSERLTQSVRATIGPYLRSLHYICAYMGWPDDPLMHIYNEVVDE